MLDEARHVAELDGATARPEGAHRTGETARGEVEEVETGGAASSPEGPPWTERFSSPEEIHKAWRNEQKVRGRLANEVGELRRDVSELGSENERLQRQVQFLQELDQAFQAKVAHMVAGLAAQGRAEATTLIHESRRGAHA